MIGRGRGVVMPIVVLSGVLAPISAQTQVVPGPGEDTELPEFQENENQEQKEVQSSTEQTTRTSTINISNTVSTRVNRAISAGRTFETLEARLGRQYAALGTQVAQQGGDGGAGALLDNLSLWASGSVTFIENDGDASPFEGEVYNPTIGADYSTPSGWVIGATLGYERTDLDTEFNGGTLESDGVVVTPYVGRRLGQHAVVDAGVGYARLGYDRTRDAAGGGEVSGSFNADRFFTFANVTGYAPQTWLGTRRVQITGRLGARYSIEDQNAFDENGTEVEGGTQELAQMTLGGGVRYFPDVDVGERLELFARADGNVDVVQEEQTRLRRNRPKTSDDRTDVVLSFGSAVTVAQGLTADISYERTVSRENIDEQSVTAGLRMSF